MPPAEYYAHSVKGVEDRSWQPLHVHLENVANLAARFAEAFGAGEWGRIAGLWHDLGKYRAAFQRRLHDDSVSADHKTAGALLASQACGQLGKALALVIVSHHGGLPNLVGGEPDAPRSLSEQLQGAPYELGEILPSVPERIRQAAVPEVPAVLVGQARDRQEAGCRLALWVRFLYSCLVDADFLDTESFYRPGSRKQEVTDQVSAGELREKLDAAINVLAAKAKAAPSEVNAVRQEVLRACRAAAERPPAVFSLTAPTGSGKTLAAMSFALRHAERWNLDRVIAVAPFTSIIDQNAKVYRDALGAENVIEHHSNLDPEAESERNRLASENWDAPVVVTTAVQFLESLFANKPSRCRKLHNIARSVILMDEAQTLPVGLLVPVLSVLKQLVQHYGCSLVLSTATQPALRQRDALPDGFGQIHEIIPEPDAVARRLHRVEVAWPAPHEQPVTWPELAALVARHDRALVIVHRRQDARDLVRLLPTEGRYHLSALMCPRHRLDVLDRVRAALEAGGRCRVVATQLIEAGVDIDFPVVYRALGGLDNIAQATGRCNREGKEPLLGRVHVFRAPTDPPPGTPRKGLDSMLALLQEHGTDLDLTDPAMHEAYFRHLYFKTELDARGIMAEEGRLSFATVAARFRMIDDAWTRPVVVPYAGVEPRLERLQKEGPNRLTLRSLQPFMVNVSLTDYGRLDVVGAMEIVHESVAVLAGPYHHLYHGESGLVLEPGKPPLADPSSTVT